MKTLRHQRWLKPVRKFNIDQRLRKHEMMLLFNMVNGEYEMHSEESYKGNLYSSNGRVEEEFVNGFLINDYKANFLKANIETFRDQRALLENMYDKHEVFVQQNNNVSSKLKVVERALGRRL
jgi:hypothetical protein